MGSYRSFVMTALIALSIFWAVLAEGVEITSPVMSARPKSYIVSMVRDAKPDIFVNSHGWFSSVLRTAKVQALGGLSVNTLSELDASQGPLHLYSTVFHGFSATLTEEQARVMESMPGVNGVFPDTKKQLHTTHTPEFLGLNGSIGLWPSSKFGEDVIVAVLDTGIWPEAFSFADHSVGPVPRRWKGACEIGTGFNSTVCNRKLIGARSFSKGYEAMTGPINETMEPRSPRDTDGHGTHTASTAAGHYVYKASLLGYAEGTARGMAPRARIAAYKVCWTQGCFDSDILAAFDQAVADGVDVISLSVGGGVVPYYLDSIAIGAFGAMKKGIFVACSAGNSGPDPITVANVAPWITTVGASTLDRDFPANVVLDNGDTIKGVSLYSGKGLGTTPYPLIYAQDAGFKNNGSDTYSASLCLAGSLDPNLVKGKIVLCDRGNNPRVAKGGVIQAAGGVGMILANTATDGEGLIADSHVLPATAVGALEGNLIKAHIRNSKNPTATVTFGGTQFNTRATPVVASFSSRGPNSETPEILKPDLLGPGVNILAAWTGDMGPTGLPLDTRRVRFNIISGTSMSCPHVSGLGALVKDAHPTWSPAAIKSALMTTASIFDSTDSVLLDEATGNMSSPFGFGAGHVRPDRALDPGLVYDLAPQDYVNFLCGLNYTDKIIQLISHDLSTCPTIPPKPQDLNYPTYSVVFDQSTSKVLATTLTRTVTNVGPARSTYRSTVVSPSGVSISVRPAILQFSAVNQKKTFTVHISTSPTGLVPGESETVFGFLTWSDNTRLVQSPIAITRAEAY